MLEKILLLIGYVFLCLDDVHLCILLTIRFDYEISGAGLPIMADIMLRICFRKYDWPVEIFFNCVYSINKYILKNMLKEKNKTYLSCI